MNSEKEAFDGWTFLYIGENPIQWAQDSGTNPDHRVCYNHKAPTENFGKLSSALSGFRTSTPKKGSNLFNSKQDL